ncbi:MAG: hypothetical protein QOD92_443 [Acidimicrobiaceae bacterium]
MAKKRAGQLAKQCAALSKADKAAYAALLAAEDELNVLEDREARRAAGPGVLSNYAAARQGR